MKRAQPPGGTAAPPERTHACTRITCNRSKQRPHAVRHVQPHTHTQTHTHAHTDTHTHTHTQVHTHTFTHTRARTPSVGCLPAPSPCRCACTRPRQAACAAPRNPPCPARAALGQRGLRCATGRRSGPARWLNPPRLPMGHTAAGLAHRAAAAPRGNTTRGRAAWRTQKQQVSARYFNLLHHSTDRQLRNAALPTAAAALTATKAQRRWPRVPAPMWRAAPARSPVGHSWSTHGVLRTASTDAQGRATSAHLRGVQPRVQLVDSADERRGFVYQWVAHLPSTVTRLPVGRAPTRAR